MKNLTYTHDTLSFVIQEEFECDFEKINGQLHPLKYLKGLTECILKMGGMIFTQTHVNDVIMNPSNYAQTKNANKVFAQISKNKRNFIQMVRSSYGACLKIYIIMQLRRIKN